MIVRGGIYYGSAVARDIACGCNPDYVFIIRVDAGATSANSGAIFAASGLTSGESVFVDGTASPVTDGITALGTGTFSIGVNEQVNAEGALYAWTAIEDEGSEVYSWEYPGNATDDRAFTGFGFQPGVVFIRRRAGNTTPGHERWAVSGEASWNSNATAPATNHIQSLDADGITIGTGAPVNASAASGLYAGVALKAVAGVLDLHTPAGDGNAAQYITGLGYRPWMIFGKPNSTVNPRVALDVENAYGRQFGGGTSNGLFIITDDGFRIAEPGFNVSGQDVYVATFNAEGIHLEPEPGRSKLVAVAPTVVLGSLTLTPTHGAFSAVAVAPTVVLGSLALTPTHGAFSAVAVAPTVVLGSLTLTPTHAGVALTAPAVTVIGSISVSVLPGVIRLAARIGRVPAYPASTLTASLQSAVVAGRHRWLLEVDLPDGSTLRKSSAGYSSIARGHYDADVLSWGGWEVGPSEDGVAAPQTTVDLADVAGVLAALIEGEYADAVEAGCTARVLVAAGAVDEAEWMLAFEGIATAEQTGPARLRWTIRCDDLALQRVAPRGTWGIGAAWPLAEADARARIAPVVYGEHDGSSAGLGRGQVPTLVLDTVQDIRLVAAGAAVDVVRVWDDDGQVSGSDYTAATTARKGRSWTTITFSAAPTGTVTVDVQGIEDDGDGGGALLTNAAEQLAHLLSNFYFADASGSSWQPTSARIDSASLAAIATWLDGRTYDGAVAHYQGEARSGYDVLREWQESLGVYAWWSGAGQITFGVRPLDGDPYETEHVLRWQSDDLDGRWAPRPERRDVTPGLSVRHQPSASGDYLASLEVRDPEATREGSASLDMPWSAAS